MRWFFLGILTVALCSCGSAPERTDDAVIVYVQRHDATLAVRATPAGLVYDVVRPTGDSAFGLDELGLQAHDPDLYEFYRQSTAGKVDATLHLPEVEVDGPGR